MYARVGTLFLTLAAVACGLAEPEADCGESCGAGGEGGGLGADTCLTVDSDGDGWSDEVERAMGTSPTDPDDNPTTRGMAVFVVPYQRPAQPAAHEIEGAARLARADVAVLLDTTGSMLGTTSRIKGQLEKLLDALTGEIDDLAFGAAGYGDFPTVGANSEYDVPFYPVHRIMTVHTPEGRESLVDAFGFRNIIDGLGPWFALMRGGDEPEQGWEALRQIATGVGITYPRPGGGVGAVPSFDAAAAHPGPAFPGEEVGSLGGLGFRSDSTPIIIMISDTDNHDVSSPTTTPPSADRFTALAALAALRARVVGLMAWKVTGHDDLRYVASATGAEVSPEVWGSGSERPANCPVGRCCLVAADPDTPWSEEQPAPVDGSCVLVFRSDRYDTNLWHVMAQAIVAIARGASFEISAELRDDPADDVDVVAAFVERVEAVAEGACGGGAVSDTTGDGFPDTFVAAPAGSDVCFRVVARQNEGVAPAGSTRRFRGILQLTGDGLASFASREVWFVVPGGECASDCATDDDCGPGELCQGSRCLPEIL